MLVSLSTPSHCIETKGECRCLCAGVCWEVIGKVGRGYVGQLCWRPLEDQENIFPKNFIAPVALDHKESTFIIYSPQNLSWHPFYLLGWGRRNWSSGKSWPYLNIAEAAWPFPGVSSGKPSSKPMGWLYYPILWARESWVTCPSFPARMWRKSLYSSLSSPKIMFFHCSTHRKVYVYT